MTTLNTLSFMPRKPLAEKDRKVGLAARIHPSVLAELEQVAKDDDRTLSYMVDKALRFFLENRQVKTASKPKR